MPILKKRFLPRLLVATLAFTILSTDISVLALSETSIQPTEVIEDDFVDESVEELQQIEENTIETEVIENQIIESEIEPEEMEISEESPNFSHLIVLVQFADTSHVPAYTKDTLQTFYGDEENPEGMRHYLYALSENTLKIENILPQYNAETEEFSTFTLENTAEYYAQNEQALL